MSFHWRYERADGAVFGEGAGPVPEEASTEAFPNQGDAESWIGEAWRELTEKGVDAVSLFEDDRMIYGPMSLHAQ